MMEVVCNFKKIDNCLFIFEVLVFDYIKKIFVIKFENWKCIVVYNEDVFVKLLSYMNVLE